MIRNVGRQAIDQLSTKIRPKKNYKTNRRDLGRYGKKKCKVLVVDGLLPSGLFVSPFHVDHDKGFNLLTDPGLLAPVNKMHACKRC